MIEKTPKTESRIHAAIQIQVEGGLQEARGLLKLRPILVTQEPRALKKKHATHLAGDAVLVRADLVPAEAHPGTLATDHLIVPDDGGAGAAVDARRVFVQLPCAVVGLDDGVHRTLLHVHALVALKKKEKNRQQNAPRKKVIVVNKMPSGRGGEECSV